MCITWLHHPSEMKEAWESVFTSTLFSILHSVCSTVVHYFIKMYVEWFRGLISQHMIILFSFWKLYLVKAKEIWALGWGGDSELLKLQHIMGLSVLGSIHLALLPLMWRALNRKARNRITELLFLQHYDPCITSPSRTVFLRR